MIRLKSIIRTLLIFLDPKSHFREVREAEESFDRALIHGKEFIQEKEKLVRIKAQLNELEKNHPEQVSQIASLREAIAEKEMWMAKDIRGTKDQTL